MRDHTNERRAHRARTPRPALILHPRRLPTPTMKSYNPELPRRSAVVFRASEDARLVSLAIENGSIDSDLRRSRWTKHGRFLDGNHSHKRALLALATNRQKHKDYEMRILREYNKQKNNVILRVSRPSYNSLPTHHVHLSSDLRCSFNLRLGDLHRLLAMSCHRRNVHKRKISHNCTLAVSRLDGMIYDSPMVDTCLV